VLGIAHRVNKQSCAILSLEFAFNILPQVMKEKEVVTFKFLLINPHVLNMVSFQLSYLLLRRRNCKLLQKIGFNLTTLTHQFFIGGDLVAKLGNLCLGPYVFLSLLIWDVVWQVTLEKDLSSLYQLVLRHLGELVKLVNFLVGVGQLIVGLNSTLFWDFAWFWLTWWYSGVSCLFWSFRVQIS